MIYNFDEPIDRWESDSGKWHYHGEGVIPMWVADMDFVSPQPVVQALQERAAHGVFGYPLGASDEPKHSMEMRRVIVERLERLYAWQVQPDEIVFLPGVVTAFNLACHALAEPGGGVVLQPPVYHPMLHAPGHAGMQCQEAPLTRRPDGTYEIDFDAFEAAFSDRTRLFLLCNPHNPVGRVFRRDELLRMADVCLRKGVPICSDEIHCDLLFSGYRHHPIASLDPEIARQTITLMAPSKTFNLAGLQFSFAIIQNPDLRKQYQEATKGLVGWVNLMGWVAALAAYCHGQEWLDQLLLYLEGNRDTLYDYVKENLPGVRMSKPQGTYLAWLDCRELGIDGSPCEFFLQRAQVAFNDGAIFGTGGEGFVRLNFGCRRLLLAEALKRMKRAIE